MDRSGRARCGAVAVLAGILVLAAYAPAETPAGDATAGARAESAHPSTVTALGRLEPKDGTVTVAGPSRPSVVIAELLVSEGDRVEAGQPLAVLDARAEHEAEVARARAQLANAQTELARVLELFRQGLMAVQLRDDTQLKVDVARADLLRAEAALAQDTVRAPVRGQVIKIHTRRGERVGPEGIAELAENDRMYARAEVYETDIGRVKVGQRATMTSPALDPALTGTVERIGLKVERLQVLDTDPAARTDARVVQVEIRLDDSPRAAALSNLQVEVAIQGE